MLYVYGPAEQTLVVVPVIVPGVAEVEAIVSDLAVLAPQAETAETVMAALVYAAGVMFTLVVPCPLLMVQPAGTVHRYEVAPVIAVQVYVPDAPAQSPKVAPVIVVGVAGLLYSVNVLAVLVPIQFPAVTLILPETNVAEKLTVTVVVP